MYDPIVTLPPDLEIKTLDAGDDLWHIPRNIWDKVWEKVTGKGIRIAILDTGYTKHTDGPVPVATRSFINGESVEDRNSHGTHCAGTALGRNGYGYAPEAELIVGKVLSNSGSGSSSGIANGIRWAVDEGAHIISMSLGGGGSYEPTNEAIDYAFSKGCWVNAAAGNSGYNGANTIGWPAKYSGCLCCAAYQINGSIANFSSGGNEIDWACPGQDIISFSNTGSGRKKMSGTSMATPGGSGHLALFYELLLRQGYAIWPTINSVREFFKANMKDSGAPGFDVRFGNGIPVMSDLLHVLLNERFVYV